MPIPMLDLRAQYARIGDDLAAAATQVLASGIHILGPNVRSFEQEAASYLQVRHATGVASGTDALLIALRALNISAGDEVITTPFSFTASASTIMMTGATPVFADIDPATFNLDPASVARQISARTRAIIVVHLYGQPVDMDAFNALAAEHKLAIIEDCAQAIGARWKQRPVGGIGAIGCFSFYPTKNLGAAGDGGLVTTNDPQLAELIDVLHKHGSRARYSADILGYNSRLDELQAALLRVKLRHLPQWTSERQAAAARYDQLLRDLPVSIPIRHPDAEHVFHQYTIRVAQRDELAQFLQAREIASMIYYPRPFHLQPLFAPFSAGQGSLPIAEQAAAEVLSLPIYPEISAEQQSRIAEAIGKFYAQ